MVTKSKKNPAKKSSIKTTGKKPETIVGLKRKIGSLAKQLEEAKKEKDNYHELMNESLNKYGEYRAHTVNITTNIEKMVGHILIGLYAIGIGPDEITEICKRVFKPIPKK